MPPGTPHNSFIVEYPYIRVDDFRTLKEPAKLHLLTHAHSDHIGGLQAKSFDQQVICSRDTKEILLRHEVYKERALHEHQLRAEKKRTYGHLKVDPVISEHGEVYYQGSKDLLKVLPLNTPTLVEISGNQSVTITLIDANHMPGSVMFLIEGNQGAVLHTGDIRAEPWFLDSLRHNPFLQPYLSVPGATPGVYKTLKAIYLDTACVMNIEDVPTKEDATTGMIALMRLMHPSTHFFLNTWTWGYEDILKAVALAFGSNIHTDRYKHSILTRLSREPILRAASVRDPSITRFHACERFERCEYVDVPVDAPNGLSTGERVVYVNPVSTMNTARWRTYQTNTRNQILAGEEVTCLLVPLARHSPLPELQAFVNLFRPKTIVPNTLDPALDNLDWAGIHRAFSPYLRGLGSAPSTQSCDLRVLNDLSHDEDGVDVSLKNLVGEQAEELAAKWADNRGKQRQLEVIRGWLGIPASGISATSTRPLQQNAHDRSGYDSSSDMDDDERGRTMHKLLAPHLGIEVVDSQSEVHSSSPLMKPVLPSPKSSPLARRPSPPLKRKRPSPSRDITPVKKRKLDVLKTPSPLPRSSPFSNMDTPTPRPKNRALSSPNLQRRVPEGLQYKATSVRSPRHGSPLKFSISMPGPSRMDILSRQRQPSRKANSHSSDDSDPDDDRGTTADFLFGGFHPPQNDSSSVHEEDEGQGEPLHDIGNIDDSFESGPVVLKIERSVTKSTFTKALPAPCTPLKTEKMRDDQKRNAVRMRNMLQYRPESPKLQTLERRESSLVLKIGHAEGKMQVLERKLQVLADEKEARGEKGLDENRVKSIMERVVKAVKEGRRAAEVMPLLECTLGAEGAQAIEEFDQ